jgi:hypothetical protein
VPFESSTVGSRDASWLRKVVIKDIDLLYLWLLVAAIPNVFSAEASAGLMSIGWARTRGKGEEVT